MRIFQAFGKYLLKICLLLLWLLSLSYTHYMHSKGARTHENDPIPWCACALGAREFKYAHFWSSCYTYILRDHLELVTKGFLHSFVANLGFTLQLKKMALGLWEITL